jgi:hypothetical protein
MFYIEDENRNFVDQYSLYKNTYVYSTHINGIELYKTKRSAEKILKKLNKMKIKLGFSELKFKIIEKLINEIREMPVLKSPYKYYYNNQLINCPKV